MKYLELITKNGIVNQIPLVFEGRKLNAEVAANIVLLKVSYNKAVENMQKELEEVQKGLKKEGFDDRASAYQEMLRVDEALEKYNSWTEGTVDSEGKPVEQPKKPTEEEINKAEETRKTKEEFLKELSELNEVYNQAYIKKLQENIEFNKGISKEDWMGIYNNIGVEGTIEYTYPNQMKREIEKSIFLQYIGELINE